jgi:tRNA threonylcarbamoyladenosine modification (KEOPS) complex  Pcc1 subunit
MRAEIQLEIKSEEDAEVVLSSVSPDNKPVPEGLVVKSRREGAKLVLAVDCKRGLQSFMATLEDIMSAVDLSIRTIETVKKE